MDQSTLNLLSALSVIFGFLGSCAAATAAIVSLRNRIVNRAAAASAHSAAVSADQAVKKGTETHDSITGGVDAMNAAVQALDTVRDSYDDLMAAYVNQKALENKVQIIGQYLFDREVAKNATLTDTD